MLLLSISLGLGEQEKITPIKNNKKIQSNKLFINIVIKYLNEINSIITFKTEIIICLRLV